MRPDHDRIRVPSRLRAAAVADGVGSLWLATLPATVADLARRWRLRLGSPFQPGGSCSWVAPAWTENARVVLKLGWRHPEAAHEADALRLWAGAGAVRLIRDETTPHGCALLLEHCRPGTPLGRLPDERTQDAIIAGLLHRLWILPPPAHPFRHLSQMCADWAAELEARLQGPSGDRLDPGLAREALALLRELPLLTAGDRLLCTDLHAGNVLAADREPWLVIDPKPHLGDPAFDAVQHLLNCTERIRADPLGLARRLAGLLDADPERVRLWLLARCVQESLDEPALAAVAARLARHRGR